MTFCKGKELVLEYIHTNGHATTEDLQAFAEVLNPKTTIPIHTFFADKYKELFKNVEVLGDGQAFDI